MSDQVNQQAVVVQQDTLSFNKATTKLALFNEDGTPAILGSSDPTIVRIIPQSFTLSQKVQALTNIGGVGEDTLVYLSENHGVVGNGLVDDSFQFQSFLNLAASFGARAQLSQSSTVLIESAAITIPSGTRLDLNGGTLKNGLVSTTGRVLIMSGVSDIWIGNGIIDGDKASYATTTEQRHNLYIVNSSEIMIENVLSKDAKGDGIYIGDNVSGMSTDITLVNFRSEGNHRAGGSATAFKGIRQFGGHYRFNGGTSPHAGFNVEPNIDGIEMSDLAFYGVHFDDNLGDGLLVQAKSAAPTQPQRGARFYGCTANNNGTGGIATFGHGVVCRWANDVFWEGGEIRDNLLRGVYLRDTCTNLRFNTDVIGNGEEGYGQPAGTITGLRIQGVVSGNGTAGTYDGVNLAGSGSFALLQGKFAANTRYGVRTLSGWSSVTVAGGSSFTGNTTGPVSLGDAVASRLIYALGVSGGVIPVGRSTTALRPAAADVSYGIWIDTTLNKIIWSNGSTWRDAMGTAV